MLILLKALIVALVFEYRTRGDRCAMLIGSLQHDQATLVQESISGGGTDMDEEALVIDFSILETGWQELAGDKENNTLTE